jgi:hypothetical protein
MISEKQASRSVTFFDALSEYYSRNCRYDNCSSLPPPGVVCSPLSWAWALSNNELNDLDKTARPLSGAEPAGAYCCAGEAAAGCDRLSQCSC